MAATSCGSSPPGCATRWSRERGFRYEAEDGLVEKYYKLANDQIRQRNYGLGVAELKKCLELEPNHEDAPKLRQLLEEYRKKSGK